MSQSKVYAKQILNADKQIKYLTQTPDHKEMCVSAEVKVESCCNGIMIRKLTMVWVQDRLSKRMEGQQLYQHRIHGNQNCYSQVLNEGRGHR